MNTGRTLDEQIHTHVMAQRVDDGRSWSIPRYSTEIAEAWPIAERYSTVEIERRHDGWYCWLSAYDEARGRGINGWAIAPTLQEAICQAALSSVTDN